MSKPYAVMLDKLASCTPDELRELFFDLEDVSAVERIANAAYEFVESWADKEIEKHELSQNEDALEVDNARRVRELE